MTTEQKAAQFDYERKVSEYGKSEPGHRTGHYRSLVEATKRLLEIEAADQARAA